MEIGLEVEAGYSHRVNKNEQLSSLLCDTVQKEVLSNSIPLEPCSVQSRLLARPIVTNLIPTTALEEVCTSICYHLFTQTLYSDKRLLQHVKALLF